ncbi:Uncharacterised protein [Kluyvera cryocrescens]|uniref:Uncharacterized protein n=1 Tax=Kluyvera cryocrescens TaxID=580 RepID=A0A485CF24_KLUCR|nr:Uncharacterised protein [Kluyvera cryocrescens]
MSGAVIDRHPARFALMEVDPQNGLFRRVLLNHYLVHVSSRLTRNLPRFIKFSVTLKDAGKKGCFVPEYAQSMLALHAN